MIITFELVLFIFFIWLLAYTLIDRICRCIEHGHLSSSYNAEVAAKTVKSEGENKDVEGDTEVH